MTLIAGCLLLVGLALLDPPYSYGYGWAKRRSPRRPLSMAVGTSAPKSTCGVSAPTRDLVQKFLPAGGDEPVFDRSVS